MKNAIYKYLVYVIYFLGIGMTSSGVVLMPFNFLRYGVVLTVGLCLFLAGSIFNEVVIDKQNLSKTESLRLIFLSLILALGIGMISGGISHYKESPLYVSYLIPIGLFLSFISYNIKNHFEEFNKNRTKLLLGITIISTILYFVLNITLMEIAAPAGGDIFKNTMEGHSM